MTGHLYPASVSTAAVVHFRSLSFKGIVPLKKNTCSLAKIAAKGNRGAATNCAFEAVPIEKANVGLPLEDMEKKLSGVSIEDKKNQCPL